MAQLIVVLERTSVNPATIRYCLRAAAREIVESKYAQQVGSRATRLAEMLRTGMDPE